jgi:hypothetical protein
MSSTLTAAGIKLCIALAWNDPTYTPTPDDCQMKFMQAGPYGDRWGRSPVSSVSCPDNNQNNEACHPKGYDCIAVETYDIFDGTKGTSWRCTRPATLKWTPDGLWYWDVELPKH